MQRIRHMVSDIGIVTVKRTWSRTDTEMPVPLLPLITFIQEIASCEIRGRLRAHSDCWNEIISSSQSACPQWWLSLLIRYCSNLVNYDSRSLIMRALCIRCSPISNFILIGLKLTACVLQWQSLLQCWERTIQRHGGMLGASESKRCLQSVSCEFHTSLYYYWFLYESLWQSTMHTQNKWGGRAREREKRRHTRLRVISRDASLPML